jgi:hypothetical protein
MSGRRPTNAPSRAPTIPVPATSAPLPTPGVPTGYVWPAHTGRNTLQSLAAAGLKASVPVDPEGSVRHTAGEHVLWTSKRWCFADVEAARQALVRAARERSQLGSLLVPDTVLVLQPSSNDASWLWGVAPILPTVVQRLEEAPEEQESVLRRFGRGIVEALRIAFRHNVFLDGAPTSFGEAEGVLRYVGEVESVDEITRRPIRILESATSGLSSFALDIQPVTHGLGVDEIRRLAIALREQHSLADTAEGRTVSERLARVIARVSEAA